MRIIIATIKSWNIERAKELREKMKGQHEIYIVTSKEEFTKEYVASIQPELILFPHWSYFIPEEIFLNWPCVVFHMTDLPFGRGGSPLQNLIVRGFKETKLSAIQVNKTFDEGPIYMKRPLSLEGSAEEIFTRCSDVIFQDMIPAFLEGIPTPQPQVGEPTVFKRRKPEDGRILEDMLPEQIYDYIRMLDAEGYPNAFLEYGDYKLEFTKAKLTDGEVSAQVRFVRKEN